MLLLLLSRNKVIFDPLVGPLKFAHFGRWFAILNSGICDLSTLSLPENADYWSCNKPVEDGKVEKYTRCKIICQDGYDFWKGKQQKYFCFWYMFRHYDFWKYLTFEPLIIKEKDVIFIDVKGMVNGRQPEMWFLVANLMVSWIKNKKIATIIRYVIHTVSP